MIQRVSMLNMHVQSELNERILLLTNSKRRKDQRLSSGNQCRLIVQILTSLVRCHQSARIILSNKVVSLEYIHIMSFRHSKFLMTSAKYHHL